MALITAAAPYLIGAGGGGIHPVRDAAQALSFKGYVAPAVVLALSGFSLKNNDTKVQGGQALYEEWLLWDITTVNGSFDLEGSGRNEGQVDGDPGAYTLITDLRLGLYGKSFSAATPWSGGAMRAVHVFPDQPPVALWSVSPNVENPDQMHYRLRVKTSWSINS